MNIIFLTMVHITDIEVRGIYQDLMREFRDKGNTVYIVTPCERRLRLKTSLLQSNGINILSVKTLNLQKTSVVEKGVGQVLVERQYKSAIRRYLSGVKFELILYSTPPITFPNVISFLREQNPEAHSYLLLKDIFPQNAVDLGMISKNGLKGLLYRFFRKKEKKLYALSDFIGCMSPANVEYIQRHNKEIAPNRVEVAPNSFALKDIAYDPGQEETDRYYIRKKYDIPTDKLVFVYGGNLGKPQGIPFLIDCLEANANRQDCFFVIVGSGTEFPKLKAWYDTSRPSSVKVMSGLPKNEYDGFVRACDVGLIFLDRRFTIPNFPSRLLSYLENKMPVLCATDANTDIGRIAEAQGFGYWCESDKPENFTLLVNKLLASDIPQMGERGFAFLKENYLVEHTYQAIVGHMKEAGE